VTNTFAMSRRFPLLFSLIVVLTACGGPTQNTETGGAAALVTQASGVQLLYAGEAPQRELRRVRHVDLQERMSIELIIVAAAALGDTVTPELVAPPVHLTIEVGPTELAGDDGMRYRMRVSGASIVAPPGTEQSVLDDLAGEVSALQQIDGFVEIDGRGNTVDASFRAPDGVNTRTRAMLSNIRQALLTVPFPEEPVGVGAQWTVSRPIDLGTVVVQQTVTYNLTELDGDRGHLEFAIRQGAAPQDMRSQDPNVSGQLHAYETSGVGYVEFDLSRLTTWSEVDVTSQMRSTVNVEGTRALVQMRLRTAVRVSPAL
jgi:hypothetical protein